MKRLLRRGHIEQAINYYPDGEPWIEPTGDNPFMFGGKERITFGNLRQYDFGARMYNPAVGFWWQQDPKSEDYYPISQYVYCGGNPVNFKDPTGAIIEGVTVMDISLAKEDIQAMFPGKKFEKFRKLIFPTVEDNDGKSLAKISTEALSEAFQGVRLNEDQKALVDITVNTINSNDVHKIEYIESNGNLSQSAEKIFAPLIKIRGLSTSTILEANGGLPAILIQNIGGGGVTTKIKNGTYSLVFKDPSFHLNGRPVTTGHEIFGHGRSLSLGRGKKNQHVDAIQTENLILRVMGIRYINSGEKHKRKGAFFPGCTRLPSFR